MISRDLFEGWLKRALRFANLPPELLDAEADAALQGKASEAEQDPWGEYTYTTAEMTWHPPEARGPCGL